MNLMEEMPNGKSPEPMVFSKPVNNTNPEVVPRRYETTMPALGFFDLDGKTFLILFLLAVVLSTYFGINVLTIAGNATEAAVAIFSPVLTSFLKLLGYSTGTAINSVADVTADAAKTGVDIAEGTIHDVGNLFLGDQSIGKGPYNKKNNEPRPDAPEDTIQTSLASSKTKWCLVGEYQNKRGCIDISESDKCMSGEVFPNEEMCRMGKPQFQSN